MEYNAKNVKITIGGVEIEPFYGDSCFISEYKDDDHIEHIRDNRYYINRQEYEIILVKETGVLDCCDKCDLNDCYQCPETYCVKWGNSEENLCGVFKKV